MKKVFEIIKAQGKPQPLLLDSPHSGSDYPADFAAACEKLALRQMEDAYVDRLVEGAPALGIAVLRALFPRSYCDVNRAEDDIDPRLLSSPMLCRPSEKSRQGAGLVHRLCRPDTPIYQRLLSPAEIEARIKLYWQPYHQALQEMIEQAKALHGAVLLLNMHSMASYAGKGGMARPDICLGDRGGESASPAITQFFAKAFVEAGYSVSVNQPYQGAEIVRRYGKPQQGFHALQIELKRSLYMQEDSLLPHAGFARVQQDLQKIFAAAITSLPLHQGCHQPLAHNPLPQAAE